MKAPTPRGEKLFGFLPNLMLQDFYGTATIRFEARRATHAETEPRRMWQYKDLPERMSGEEARVRPQDLRKSECA